MLNRPAAAAPDLDGMSSRELEALALLAQGLANAPIGRQLFLTEKTVRNNVFALLAKTGLSNRPDFLPSPATAGWDRRSREGGTLQVVVSVCPARTRPAS